MVSFWRLFPPNSTSSGPHVLTIIKGMKYSCARCKKLLAKKDLRKKVKKIVPVSPAAFAPPPLGTAPKLKCPHCGLANVYLEASLS